MPLPFTTDDITVLPSTTGTDPDTGNDTLTYPEDGTVVRGSFQPQSSSENTSGKDQVVTTYRVFLDGDVALKPTDRLLSRGVLVEVQGEPQRWPDPFSDGIHHIEANAEIVTG
jgi:hypothetical protein